MSVLDEIKQLEAKKQKLMKQAHDEALADAEDAIKELNSLGYNYRITGGNSSGGKRRTGIRSEVLSTIKKYPDGISRQELLSAMGATDKSSQQSISNAVSALKKQGTITGDNGIYQAS